MTTILKECRRCNEVKSADDYRRGHICRECERQQSRWRTARPHNRLYTALKDAKRSAAKYDAPDTLTLDDIRYLFTLSGGRCAYTGKLTDKPSIEHVVPLSRGGTNTLDNVQIVDLSVNLRKSDADPSDFLDRYYGFYMTRDIIELVAARRGVDYRTVYDEFTDAQAEYNTELYRKLTGSDAV